MPGAHRAAACEAARLQRSAPTCLPSLGALLLDWGRCALAEGDALAVLRGLAASRLRRVVLMTDGEGGRKALARLQWWCDLAVGGCGRQELRMEARPWGRQQAWEHMAGGLPL